MKKFLQKSGQWLVMLIAWFAVSATAWAQDVTFTINEGKVLGADHDVTLVPSDNFMVTWTGLDVWRQDEYNSDWGFTIESEEAPIEKIVLTANGYSLDNVVCNCGTFTASTKTWIGSSNSVYFHQGRDADEYVQKVEVWLGSAAPIDPIEYHVVFVDAPKGAAVVIDGTEYTADASWTIAKKLKAASLTSVVEPDGYYAEKAYDAGSHTFTVTYKHWYTYNFVVEGPTNGYIRRISNWASYYNGSQIQVKEAIAISDFEAYDVNGYDEGEVTYEAVDAYTTNVKLTYTQSASKTYTIVFPENAPEGVIVKVYDEQGNFTQYTASSTFESPLVLNGNYFNVVTPDSHWCENVWNCYDAEEHTFTVKLHEYDKYYVAVEGTDKAEAGVVFNYKTYHAGDIIYVNYELTESSVTVANVAGLEGSVTLSGKTFTVTYFVPDYILIDTSVSSNEGIWTLEGSGVTVEGKGVPLNVWYSYGNNWTATVSSSTFPIEKIEFVERYGGKTMNCYVDNGTFSDNVWTCGDGNYYSVTFDPKNGDYYISSVRVWLKQPVERENTVEIGNEISTWVSNPVNPVPGDVTEILQNLTIYFNANCDSGHSYYNGYTDIPVGVKMEDAEGTEIAVTQFNYWKGSDQVGIVLENKITTPGVYTLTIPAGTIPFEGNKANKEIVLTWTVLDPVVGHLAMSDAGYATLCVNYAYTLPEGYTAYAVGKDVNGTATLVGEDGSIILNPLNSVAAGTAVIIEGPEAADVTLLRASSASAPAVNFLVGFTYEANNWSISNIFGTDWCPGSPMVYDTFSNFSIYQLANEEGKVGFYRQKAEEGKFYCAANKAVLVVPAPDAESNARFLLPGQEVITGIDGVIATEAAENIFNLQGQRVIAPAKGGVYVKNGKKIIVK